MGYETSFTGEFAIQPPLSPEHLAYLRAFHETRRMKRDPQGTASRLDSIREAVGLPVGAEGGYFVSAGGHAGQEEGGWVLDFNHPPTGQPGLWCCWEPTEDGTGLWIEHENKHYHYIEWLQYLLKHFLIPWGYTLSGKVKWKGEERKDRGFLVVTNNHVLVNQEPTLLDKIVEAVSPNARKAT